MRCSAWTGMGWKSARNLRVGEQNWRHSWTKPLLLRWFSIKSLHMEIGCIADNICTCWWQPCISKLNVILLEGGDRQTQLNGCGLRGELPGRRGEGALPRGGLFINLFIYFSSSRFIIFLFIFFFLEPFCYFLTKFSSSRWSPPKSGWWLRSERFRKRWEKLQKAGPICCWYNIFWYNQVRLGETQLAAVSQLEETNSANCWIICNLYLSTGQLDVFSPSDIYQLLNHLPTTYICFFACDICQFAN